MKKWLANIIEVVHYLHQIGIVHRNLKPGSFYLQQTESNDHSRAYRLILGDFCVPSVAMDARTKTRIAQGAFDYTAPEIIDAQSFTFKSDMWSIGATLFNICTTSLFDVKQLWTFQLFETKTIWLNMHFFILIIFNFRKTSFIQIWLIWDMRKSWNMILRTLSKR